MVTKQIEIGHGMLSFADQGQGAAILFVHGFPLDHKMWKYQIDSFAESYRVIAPDLMGFGASQSSKQEISIEGMADELAELLEKLQIQQVVFCGLSMGGYIGWKFWERHREKLIALVACDTRVIADTIEIARGRRILATRLLDPIASKAELTRRVELFAETLLPKLFCNQTRQQNRGLVDETMAIICSTNPHAIAQAQLAMANRESYESRLSQFDIPALVVAGKEDVISPAAEMREFAIKIPGGEFFKMPGGHMAPLEQPDAFNSRLKKFLARVLAESSRESDSIQ